MIRRTVVSVIVLGIAHGAPVVAQTPGAATSSSPNKVTSTSLLPSGAQPKWAAAAPICSGSSVLPMRTGKDRNAPYINLTWDKVSGPWLIDYGAGGSVIEKGIWTIKDDDPRFQPNPAPDGAKLLKVDKLSLPGWDTISVVLRYEDRNISVPDLGPQHGVIANDVIGLQNVEIYYGPADERRVAISKWKAGCDTKALPGDGFVKVGQKGHWEDVSGKPDGIHNGPVIYFDLADASSPDTKLNVGTFAQIDTGYEDNVLPFTVEVNQAAYDQLAKLKPALTEGQRLDVRTCNGSVQQRRTFTAPGRVLRIETEAGARILSLDTFTFVLKGAGEGCGGVGDSKTPAAQIGASFMPAFGTTLFLGPAKEVWIRPPASTPFASAAAPKPAT